MNLTQENDIIFGDNVCELCGHENHIDNFKCEGNDCGVPLDLELTYNEWGLPELTQKK